MKTRLVVTCLLVACCAVLSPAFPQQVDKAKESAIRRMITLMGGEEALRESVTQMRGASLRELERRLPAGERSHAFIAAYRERMDREVDYHALLEATVPIYDRYFTLEDIQGLNQFYESRVGQRYIRVMPQFSADLMAVGAQYQREVNRKVLSALLEEYPEFKPAGGGSQR